MLIENEDLKDVKLLQSGNINKACRTGKPYKNLIFKFKTKAPTNSDIGQESGELLGSLQSLTDYNIIGNGKCERLKTVKIRLSAAEHTFNKV